MKRTLEYNKELTKLRNFGAAANTFCISVLEEIIITSTNIYAYFLFIEIPGE